MVNLSNNTYMCCKTNMKTFTVKRQSLICSAAIEIEVLRRYHDYPHSPY